MKKTFLFFSIALFAGLVSTFVSCTQEHVYTIDEIYAKGDSLVDDTIMLQGLCTHLCQHGGKKAFLKGTAENKSFRINSVGFDRFAPECINNTVKVKAVIRAFAVKPVESDTLQHGVEGEGCETEKTASRNYYAEGLSYEIIKKR